jgi:hypothetical protein
MLLKILFVVIVIGIVLLFYSLWTAPLDVTGCQLSDDDLEEFHPSYDDDGYQPTSSLPPPTGGHP